MDSEKTVFSFDDIPDGYGAGAAVMEPPVKKPDPEPPVVADPPKVEKPDDLLAPRPKDGEGAPVEKPEKTPAQYAAERREAKAKRNELLEKAPKLEEENSTLRSRIAELEALTQKSEEERGAVTEDIETLREQARIADERAKAAEQRYIAAAAPQVNPYEDEEVQRHMSAVQTALTSNLPRLATNREGTKVRIDLNLVQKDPARKGAIDTAIKDYTLASESGDTTAMDRAVVILGTALGNLDVEDDEVREKLDSALAAASQPFAAGLMRYKAVQENAVQIATQRRANQIRETEARLLAPLMLDSAAVDEALEKDPDHPWANFSVLFREMPEDFRKSVEAETRRDAMVLGALQFIPPPLPANATQKEIGEHETLVRASNARAMEAARYVAVGRAVLDGGILAHMRAETLAAKQRLEEIGESLTIPSGGADSSKGKEKSDPWGDVPDNYSRR